MMSYESAEQYVSILKEWIPKEASVAIAIDGTYVNYFPGIHDIQITIGQSVEVGSIAYETAINRCKTEKNIDKKKTGIPYYGIGYPISIKDSDAVVVIILPTTQSIVNKQPLTFLTGKNEDNWCPIPVDKISHIESFEKKTWFYKTDEAYQSIYTLKELIQQLPQQFLRIHRSYIVNIQHILEISRDFSSTIIITLKNGTVLPVSQSYTTAVRNTLGF